MRVEKIVVHCSASKWGNAEIIDDWHRQRGFIRREAFSKDSDLKYIGYHYLIQNGKGEPAAPYVSGDDGLVIPCRNQKEVGAHAWGLNNRSIGVCLVGKDEFTDAQMRSLHGVCQALLTEYNLGPVDIIGHCETAKEQSKPKDKRKTCPNFDVGAWKAGIDWIF